MRVVVAIFGQTCLDKVDFLCGVIDFGDLLLKDGLGLMVAMI